MLRSAAITLLQQRLQRVGDTDIEARIISEMKLVQESFEQEAFLPWFLLSENLTESTTASEERVAIPATFLREAEEGALWVYDTALVKWIELKKDDYGFLLNKFPTEIELPQYYALTNNYFRLKPTPDIVYSLRMKCYLADTVLSTDIENNWLKYASDWIVSAVGYNIAAYHLRNEKLAKVFAADLAVAKNRVWIANEARMHANRDYTMGGEDG